MLRLDHPAIDIRPSSLPCACFHRGGEGVAQRVSVEAWDTGSGSAGAQSAAQPVPAPVVLLADPERRSVPDRRCGAHVISGPAPHVCALMGTTRPLPPLPLG